MSQEIKFGRPYSIHDSRPYFIKEKKKICNKCKKEKKIDEFGKKPESIDRHDTICKECQNERQAQIRAARKSNIYEI